MIIVQINRMEDGSIRGFSVKGHANYAKRGEDIVCAGVSAVTVGAVNSIEALTGVVLNSKIRNGFLSADIPDLEDEDIHSKVQLLMESMKLMLEGIAESYGEYIQIHNK
ncbi:ribosomal-processing cysteine protease Prp [Paenibacillus sp. P96]|uniref:Ribosomal processing cysteine protease Prp n=1 Tax=Paenibacillus zeirhizosphaerae TaxID=2987519 RepID=A0ABT9FLR1_9BACL|nr:ribosomal-processing cysteine protease Prp [Paenibacillus sp. P96]MDP4095655.1 ribosomal-processing cysteine protease Prp [Paenibacillus sp. P96]